MVFMVYHGIPWYTMEYHGISWYTMVYHGIPWYTMEYHGIFSLGKRVPHENIYHGSSFVSFTQCVATCGRTPLLAQ